LNETGGTLAAECHSTLRESLRRYSNGEGIHKLLYYKKAELVNGLRSPQGRLLVVNRLPQVESIEARRAFSPTNWNWLSRNGLYGVTVSTNCPVWVGELAADAVTVTS